MRGSDICASQEGFVEKHGRWVAIRQADEGEKSLSGKSKAMFLAGHTVGASVCLECKVLAGRVGASHGKCARRVRKFEPHHLGGGESRTGRVINRPATWPDESFRFFGQHGGGQTGVEEGDRPES